jgi:transcriptional regulator with XRE-family HTH domain
MDEVRKAFGRKVQTLMLKKGWNQSELARRADMGRDNVSGYIRGKNTPNSKHLQRLSDALGVTPDELFPGVIATEISDESIMDVRVLRNDPTKSALRINAVVPNEVAFACMKLISEAKKEKS